MCLLDVRLVALDISECPRTPRSISILEEYVVISNVSVVNMLEE